MPARTSAVVDRYAPYVKKVKEPRSAVFLKRASFGAESRAREDAARRKFQKVSERFGKFLEASESFRGSIWRALAIIDVGDMFPRLCLSSGSREARIYPCWSSQLALFASALDEQICLADAPSMAPPSFPPAAFSSSADPMLKRAPGASALVKRRRFAALFGVAPHARSSAWDMMREHLPRTAEACHLLWALLFLKAYAVEHVNAAIANVDEKTFRK